VLGEAMACGVPCVVTDVGDSAKLVGETGIVVPSEEPVLLADALNTLLVRRADVRPEQIREAITSRFAVDSCVEATEAALAEAQATV
jgi:glycosyltransferase involved in cell wall biosynthesis